MLLYRVCVDQDSLTAAGIAYYKKQFLEEAYSTPFFVLNPY